MNDDAGARIFVGHLIPDGSASHSKGGAPNAH